MKNDPIEMRIFGSKFENTEITLCYLSGRLNLPLNRQERMGGRVFGSNFALNFRVLIQPYLSGLIDSFVEEAELDS